MLVTRLGGYSGCKVLLCEKEDKTTYVRKISADISYNERLKCQCEKQAAFQGKRLKTPKVLKKGFDENGLFYFDMEYVQGITVAEYLKTIEIGQVRNIVETILDEITGVDEKASVRTGDSEHPFLEKISELEQKISVSDGAGVFSEAVRELKAHNWRDVPASTCHGDLTLENIIVKDGQLWLIDFLDSFYDSWMLDAATILQDAQSMWAYRHEVSDINTVIRLIIFRDVFVEELKKRLGGRYTEVYYALLLKLVRICPYVQDESTEVFLQEKIGGLLSAIREKEGADGNENITCFMCGK